jgi:hypothetical protein
VTPALQHKPWTSASAPIWGANERVFKRRTGGKPLVALQVYVDDSASDEGDQRLFLAGYMNMADKWARFSEAWQEELRASPAIDYLKMSEANSLGGQFRGWDIPIKDEKLRGLARVIRHFEPASIHSSISRAEFKAIVSPVAPYGFNRPYFYCFHPIMVSLANSMLEFGLPRVPIDFIFDEQGAMGEEARFFYRIIRDGQPAAVRSLLSRDPVFRDDKLVVPLQAADMLAWHVRRNHISNPDAFQVPDFLSADGQHMAIDIDAAYLTRIADGYGKISGTQQLMNKAVWKKTMREIGRIEEAGGRPDQRRIRISNTVLYWRRRGARILSRFLAHFSRR